MNRRPFILPERMAQFIQTALLVSVGIPLLGLAELGTDSHGLPFAALTGMCMAAQKGEKIFTVDVEKQKQAIEKDFAKVKDNMGEFRLQNARSVLGLVDYKITQLSPNLPKQEALALKNRFTGANKYLSMIEDSLGNRCLDILHSRGVEAALTYMQQDLRSMGVSELKLNQVEKTILDKAPEIEQAKERAEIDRTVQLLLSGQSVDPSTYSRR
jgi:hypothetical protein